MQHIKKALVLAPHPDDGELSSGGTIKLLTDQGCEVRYVAFSPCNKSLPEGYEEGTLYLELANAIAHLGIPNERMITFDYPVRDFPQHRQSILEAMIKIRNEFRPELVFLPNSDDVHQDHHVIYEEGVRAFKHCKLLGYELPWNNLHMKTNFHVKLEQKHLEAKVNALSEYKTQKFRNYFQMDFIRSLAIVRGTQAGSEYAEAFECIRWIH